MQGMRKFTLFVFTVFFATTAMAAPKQAAFSLHCQFEHVNCEIRGDRSSVIEIENCDSPKSWKPPAGKAYLIDPNKLHDCLNRMGATDCDWRYTTIADPLGNDYFYLLSCEEDTKYEMSVYGGTDSLWQHETKGGKSAFGMPYKEQLCLGTGGRFNSTTNTCDCPWNADFTENGCMCHLNDGKIKFIANTNMQCADLTVACSASGGHYRPNNRGEDADFEFGKCQCPSDLNLIQTETKDGCMCKPGFTWQNPLQINGVNGCVKKGETFNINIPIKSSNGEPLSGVTIKYSDEDGTKHELITNSDGIFKTPKLQNTSFVTFTKDDYVTAMYAAVTLSSKTDVELQYLSPEDKGLFYQKCLLQPEDPTRASSGLRVKTDTPTDDNWLYCGGFVNERDCGNGHRVVSMDNIIYKCHVDRETKTGTWVQVNVEEIESCFRAWNDRVFCNPFEHIFHEATGKIIAVNRDQVTSPNGTRETGYARTVCYHDSAKCSGENHFTCSENVCPKLETGPKWGIPDPVSTNNTDDDGEEDVVTTIAATCEESGGILDADGTTCKCETTNGLKANADNTLCECIQSNMTFDATTKKCTVSTDAITDNLGNIVNNITNKNEQLDKAVDAYKKAKDNEQSLANRTLTAASTAATGLGMMTMASAKAEQKADEEAEQDMKAYLATFKCEYGRGQSVKASEEEVTLPGGNELVNYYQEYKSLADNLKNTKKALGLRAGIESEVVYDKAESNLYKYSSVGKTDGAFTSLSRALTDNEGEDAAAWNAQKEETAQKVKTGTIAAGGGILGGVAGDAAINTDMIQNIANKFKGASTESE